MFTTDWFTYHIPNWQKQLAKFKGQPNLRFLEIGSYEGRSARWLLENILTDTTSKIVCVDVFGPTAEYDGLQIDTSHILKAFEQNVALAFPEQVITIQGYSYDRLKDLRPNTYQFIYIDGSHKSPEALEDAVLCWRLLQSGGRMCFDDYGWDTYAGTLENPKIGIDAFLTVYAKQYRLLHKEYQVLIEKL